MNRHKLNRLCTLIPVILSWTAFVWVLGNVAGGTASSHDEGAGFYIFWLLILAQVPFILGHIATARVAHWPKVTLLQIATIVLAFAPVFYFGL